MVVFAGICIMLIGLCLTVIGVALLQRNKNSFDYGLDVLYTALTVGGLCIIWNGLVFIIKGGLS